MENMLLALFSFKSGVYPYCVYTWQQSMSSPPPSSAHTINWPWVDAWHPDKFLAKLCSMVYAGGLTQFAQEPMEPEPRSILNRDRCKCLRECCPPPPQKKKEKSILRQTNEYITAWICSPFMESK